MNSFKRQVSPGAAVFLVVIVLASVQWIWWRGLIYKPPPPPRGSQLVGAGVAGPSLILRGHQYVKVDTLAGALDPGCVDGPDYAARFDRPTGLALDRAGILYVCDTGNHRIRTVAANGSVSTFAGSDQGYKDGPALQAKFNAPCGICFSPEGAIYIADTGNGVVRRILGGQVTTIVNVKSAANSKANLLPVAVEYRDKPAPYLLVLDAGSKSLGQYDVDGTYRSSSIQKEPVVIQTSEAAANSSQGALERLPITGTGDDVNVAKRPFVEHLVGLCTIGSGALATDLEDGAVFYVKAGSADVLAGVVSSAGPIREWRDGGGDTAMFGNVTGVVTDGAKYAYVADTSNNCIRRLTLPGFMFK